MKKHTSHRPCVAGSSLTAAVATAQTPPPPASMLRDKSPAARCIASRPAIKPFVKEAAIGGMAEVELGTLAEGERRRTLT